MTVWYPNEITIKDVRYVERKMESPVEATISVLQDKKLWQAASYHITDQDHGDIRSTAIREYIKLPPRCRMRGMIVDLDHYEKLALCWISAIIEVCNRKSYLVATDIMGPSVYTEVQEVIDEQTYGMTFTQQKK